MKIKATVQIIEYDGPARQMVVANEGDKIDVSDTFGARMVEEGRATEIKGKVKAEPKAEETPAEQPATPAEGGEGEAPTE